MLVVGCIPNFSSERFVAVELLVPVLAQFNFYLLSLLFSSFSNAFCLHFISLHNHFYPPLI